MSLCWNRLASRAHLLDRPIHSVDVNYRAYIMAGPTAPDTGSTAPARRPATQIFRESHKLPPTRLSARRAVGHRPLERLHGPS